MWWDRTGRALAALAATLLVAGGCQVRPLYAPGPSGTAPQASLPAIDFETPQTRIEQVYRNELSFLATGGAGAATPAYRLDYVLATDQSAIGIQPTTGLPATYQVSGTVNFRLTAADGETVLLEGAATSVASLDRSSQNFANLRAFRDAEDRIAADLARRTSVRLATWFARR